MPKIAATPMIRWKWATTKRGVVERNVQRRLRQERAAQSAGDEQRNEADRIEHRRLEANPALYSVPSQLNVLIADGTPIAMVMIEKANAE